MLPRSCHLLAVVSALTLSACGGNDGPTASGAPRSTLSFTAPAEVRGDLEDLGGFDFPTTSNLKFGCRYPVVATVPTGATPVTLTGARLDLVSTPDAAGAFRLTSAFPAESLGTLFGTSRLGPGQVGSTFFSFIQFPPGPEPRGSVGAHVAQWVFTYTAGTRTDSARFSVRCLPAIGAIDVLVDSANFLHPLGSTQVTLGGVTKTTNERGQIRFDSVVVGRHSLSIRRPSYAPVDTTVFVSRLSIAQVDLRPLPR